MIHREVIQLIVAYTFAAVIIYTAVITALSLTGVVKFRTENQQKTLFGVLIVELVVAAVAFFADFIKFDATPVSEKVALANSLPEIRAAVEQAEAELEAARKSEDSLKKKHLSNAYSHIHGILRGDHLGDLLPFRDLFRLRGEIAHERNIWQDAASSYGIALEVDPDDFDLLVGCGDAYRRLTRYEEAETLYRRAIAIDDQNFEGLQGLQNCLRRYAGFLEDINYANAERKYNEALDLVTKMRSLASDDRERRIVNVARPRIYWQWDRLRTAADEYRELVGRYPTDREYRMDLAAVLIEDGQKTNSKEKIQEGYDLYAEVFREVVDKDSDELRGRFGDLTFSAQGLAEAAAEISLTEEQLKEALRAASIAKREAPRDPFTHAAAAKILMIAGEREDAIKSIKEAIHLEEGRQANLYTTDLVRLNEYRELLDKWTSKPNSTAQ